MTIADHGIAELGKYVDSLITIPNEKLLAVLGSDTTLIDAFQSANEVLQGAVQGIAELITTPGTMNVDFADVRTVMSEMGMAMMGSGVSSGEGRAREAAEAAISSPLLEDVNLSGANGILVNVTSDLNLTIGEFSEIGDTIKEFAASDATVIIGSALDQSMQDEVRVTVVATGLGKNISQSSPMRIIKKDDDKSNEAPDYDTLSKPITQRNKALGDDIEDSNSSEDLLNVPAFLRRQAD